MEAYQYEINFLNSLFLTVLTEVLLLYALMFFPLFSEIKENGRVKAIVTGALSSILTLPYLWFVLPIFLHNKIQYHLLGELTVVFVESLFYYFVLKVNYKKLLFVSIICNAGSYVLGLLVF